MRRGGIWLGAYLMGSVLEVEVRFSLLHTLLKSGWRGKGF
jgi:hypothetical protein